MLISLDVFICVLISEKEGSVNKLFAGDAVADEGKYVVVWKRIGEHWRIYKDIFNSDLPQA